MRSWWYVYQGKNFKICSSRSFVHVLVCNFSLYWLSFLRQTDNRKGKIQNNPYLLVKICHHGEKHGAFIKIIHLVRRLLNTKEDIQQRRRDQIVDEYSFKVHPFLIPQMSSPISYLFCITHRKRFYLLRTFFIRVKVFLQRGSDSFVNDTLKLQPTRHRRNQSTVGEI